jgi:hypothetical protein
MTGDHESGRVRRLFQDLLGRPPYEQERSSAVEQTTPELVDTLLGLEEAWGNWYEEQLYYFLLLDNFRPASDRLEAIPAELQSKTIGIKEALHRICISSAFDRRNPGPDTFVSVVMEQLLGITVQKLPRELETGKRLYEGARGKFLGVEGNAQADVVSIAIRDARMLPHFVAREHARILRQAAPQAEVTRWSAMLARDDHQFTVIQREWLLSPAYEQRLLTRSLQPNRVFVRSLFVDVLGRLPGPDETQRIRGALDGLAQAGPLRALVARVVLDSKEARVPDRQSIEDPARWIGELFGRLLGRAPTAEEQETFLAALSDPACKPSTVVYAIVSHPEYQTW